MTTSKADLRNPVAVGVIVIDDSLTVDLSDGRTLTVPRSWYPRLAHGTADEIAQWEPIAGGEGIHWPKLDEEISVAGLLRGGASNESPQSLQRWLESRENAGPKT